MYKKPDPQRTEALATSPPKRLRIFSYVTALLSAALLPFSHVVAAEQAFPGCDGAAYLTQGHLSRTYAMDLNSGDYKVVAKYHTNQVSPPYAWTDKASLDALGFNANDNFVYGWSQFHEQVVRVHADWTVEPLELAGNPKGRFYAGDVSAIENRLYLYTGTSGDGIYYVELDPAHADHGKMLILPGSKNLRSDIQDMAVHPSTGLIYAVESNGSVIEIDPATGQKTVLGNAQVYSNFGASFFDDAGNLYIGRNYDGKWFSLCKRCACDCAERLSRFR